MKRILLIVCLNTAIISCFAQGDSTLSPSVRFKVFPSAKLLLSDSLTFFSKADLPKKKQFLMMVFNPECDHCQHETEEIIKNIEKFKGIHIIMATLVSISEMNQFIEKYKLTQFENIVVVKDVGYFLPTYYQFKNFPFLAFYDKKQLLISEFNGSLPIEQLLKKFEK